jgi:hypothetical protein
MLLAHAALSHGRIEAAMIFPMIDVQFLVEFLFRLARHARLRRKSPRLRIELGQCFHATYANPSFAYNRDLEHSQRTDDPDHAPRTHELSLSGTLCLVCTVK